MATITVDWMQSPRRIEIDLPDTSVSVQELVDLIRDIEDEFEFMSEPRLIDTAGKTKFDATRSTGITLTFENAQVCFAARPGPSDVQVTISGGNLAAVAADLITPISPICLSAFTQTVFAQDTSAALVNEEMMLDSIEKTRKVLFNRQFTDPSDGKHKVFNDADDAVEFEGDVFEDTAGSTPYTGSSTRIDRRNQLS